MIFWDEFEAGDSLEARFALAIDRLQPSETPETQEESP